MIPFTFRNYAIGKGRNATVKKRVPRQQNTLPDGRVSASNAYFLRGIGISYEKQTNLRISTITN